MRCIDADALTDDCRKYLVTLNPDRDAKEYAKVNWVIGLLNNAPTIEPEQKWIPCSERLPKKPNMYTVTDSKGDVVRFIYTGTNSSREYWLRCAKAWMPLPEPYRGEQE